MLSTDSTSHRTRRPANAPQQAFRRGIGAGPGATLLAVVLAACSGSAPTVQPASPEASANRTPAPAPTVAPLDLAAIALATDAPPAATTLSDAGGGPRTLEQLPLSPETAAELLAAPGFVDGRWSRFAGSEADFAASKAFILTWVAQYGSTAAAKAVFAILLDELQSDDHYGWGVGEDAGLGDEGTCLEGDNPEMGGLHETICLWRRGSLVLIVGGGSENETPIPVDARAMDARAAALVP
jgi:hypothetical protein